MPNRMASSPMSCGRLSSWTFATVMLQIIGLWLFVAAFFPVKPTIPGFSGSESYRMPTCEHTMGDETGDLPPEQLAKTYKDLSQISPAFDRMILMVIDGLPAEFVLGRGGRLPDESFMEAMPYTQYLLSERKAIAFYAKAAPPTVTMPRLKAMVSGAIGGFLDVAFNFNTQAFLDDNLLGQLYKIGWKMVMFGDDTWMKLFPNLFARYDGVNSFFVKDTVEVDFNVTRNLEAELGAKDWKMMILHYLGLDHAGHIGGRHSLLMASKLKEMDDIIRLIHSHEALNEGDSGRHTLLVIVSDHGMTEKGNHGGSSYEETDSLAFFVDLWSESPIYPSSMNDEVFQVDLAPTLALLFGVPIPMNNIGVLLIEVFNTLTEDHKLRALELNSWQLLRLLNAQLPQLLCGAYKDSLLQSNEHFDSIDSKLYYLYSRAESAHTLWRLRDPSDNSTKLDAVVALYYDFLRFGSEWLSHKATDKPIKWVLAGIAILLLSSISLFYLLFLRFNDHYMRRKHDSSSKKHSIYFHLDEIFVSLGTVLHIFSLGSSSMVEEEQYTWHFFSSTLCLILLYITIQSFLEGQNKDFIKKEKDENFYYKICSLLIILICERILWGWHRGGVNWAHLSDISKWLEQSSSSAMKALEIASVVLVTLLSVFALNLLRSRTMHAFILSLCIAVLGYLGLLHIIENRPVNPSTMTAQIFYHYYGILLFGIFVFLPWILPLYRQEKSPMKKKSSISCSSDAKSDAIFTGLQDSLYLIGVMLASSWCLLQIFLHRPVNAVPIFLIFVQKCALAAYFSANGQRHSQLVEVATLYFLGMAGHFSLGNSNTLATIDVAGAFMGISSYSMVFPSILMFIITFSSPILSYLTMLVSISTKDFSSLYISEKPDLGHLLKLMIASPCLLLLGFNAAVLTAFTVILLLMRNHLFVWSVFSPKYLYVCAGTVSVYIGLCVVASTVLYNCTVFFFRAKLLKS